MRLLKRLVTGPPRKVPAAEQTCPPPIPPPYRPRPYGQAHRTVQHLAGGDGMWKLCREYEDLPSAAAA